jgi:hypothetical protein
MEDCVFEIASHCNEKGIRALSCLTVACSQKFTREDIYLFIFRTRFQDRSYFAWWSYRENYLLQTKYEDKMCLLISESQGADSIIYKACPLKNHLISINTLDSRDWDEDPYTLIKTDFTVQGEYALYENWNDEGLEHIATCESIEEAMDFLKTSYEEGYGNYIDDACTYVIVKLSDLKLEFGIKKNAIKHRRAWSRMFRIVCLEDLELLRSRI